MRRTQRTLVLAALGCLGICAAVAAQSTSGRWLPRLSEIFSSGKNTEADKKKVTPQPVKAPPSPAKAPASQTKAPVFKKSAPPVSPFDPPESTAPESTTPESTVVVEEKSSRLMEIVVEMALLSDPMTFPCLLEARVEGQGVKVQGHVPSKAVRERALKLVQLNCPLQVIDGMKEHPGSVPPRTARPDPRTLEDSALTALKQSLPGDDRNFEVKCGTDGRTEVTGFVRSFEEKLKVSQALRRLHGCVCVLNKVHVLADEGVTPASAPAKQPSKIKKAEAPKFGPRLDSTGLDREAEQPVKPNVKTPATAEKQPILPSNWASATVPGKATSETPWRTSGNKTTTTEKNEAATTKPAIQQTQFTTQGSADSVPTPGGSAPLPFPSAGATVSQDRVPSPPVTTRVEQPAVPAPSVVTKVEQPTRQVTTGARSNHFKQLIESACGASIRDVSVEVISPTDLLVQFRVRNENDARQVARRVLSMPELDRYRVEVRVKVPQ